MQGRLVRNPAGVAAFLVLTFAIAWASWEAVIRIMHLDVTSAQFQLYALPGAFAPAIAAVMVRLIGGEGFADAGLRPNFRRWPYYVFALLLPVAVAAAIAFEADRLGPGHADFAMTAALKAYAGRGLPAHASGPFGAGILPGLLLSSLITTPILWGEEFGWRGYLQPRLFPGRPIAAAIATGPIWAIWHYPVVLRGYDYGDQPIAGAVVMIGCCILTSYIFAWLVERSGSIWSSSLAHSATNGVGAVLTTLWFFQVQQPVLTSYIGLLGLPPLFLVCLAIFFFGRPARSQPGSAAGTAIPSSHPRPRNRSSR